jgi:hypothetical protein
MKESPEEVLELLLFDDDAGLVAYLDCRLEGESLPLIGIWFIITI